MIEIESGKINLYIMDVEAFSDLTVYNSCLHCVSKYRRDKVERLRQKKDKITSLAAGVLLAYGLNEYAGVDERDAVYTFGKRGKPYITFNADSQFMTDSASCGGQACTGVGRTWESDLHFSLSHCEGYVALVIGDVPCGVDVERIRMFPPSIVDRLFSEKDKEIISHIRENAATVQSSEDGRFACANANAETVVAALQSDIYCTQVWTRREAYGKMTGDGVLMRDEAQGRVMEDDFMRERGVAIWNLFGDNDGRWSSQNSKCSHTNCTHVAAVCVNGERTFIDSCVTLDSKAVAAEFSKNG